MNIVVLVKQVPAISDIQLDEKDNNLVRVGAPSMLNPVDMHAVEAALAVKDIYPDATITLVTMGPSTAGEVMREGIAIGADRGILISDEKMAGSDTVVTARILSKAIEKLGGADLIFAGNRSNDGDTGQIPPSLAEMLHMSLLSHVDSVSLDGTELKGTRKNRGGIETIAVSLPAVCSVTEKVNTPRQARIKGKMAAKKAVFDVWRTDTLGLQAEEVGSIGSVTHVTNLFAPEAHTVGKMIAGDTMAQAVDTLIKELVAEKLI
ncbi:electron transfer flavoprotein subunit alpha [Veillonellaceae bacterium M2-8]|uniref:electron transfer flavoprotein subunit beta/FixA family protein n=1 Tax=uncultured Megasphaera sp. TaxID=165188 RepID=UPI0012E2A3DE|nr:electron transfer flavoprotein subunit beta/FixA family protein [uncultured Megasphaera sp.]MUP48274.1 electron transfer flavoprotein subunit alpha [Veillonellaceae bacterium M2-8]